MMHHSRSPCLLNASTSACRLARSFNISLLEPSDVFLVPSGLGRGCSLLVRLLPATWAELVMLRLARWLALLLPRCLRGGGGGGTFSELSTLARVAVDV